MTGLYVSLSSADAAEENVGRMLRSVRYHDWYREERYAAPGIAVGCLSHGWGDGKLFVSAEGARNEVAALAGEIYDAADHRRRLAADGIAFRGGSQAEICLRAFRAYGRGFFAGLNGKFTFGIWEAARRRFTLVGDRLGMLPFYYAVTGDGIVLASQIKPLVAGGLIPRRPDPNAIATFFAFQQSMYVDDATFIADVRRVSPAGWLRYHVDGKRLQLERYWDPRSLAGRVTEDDTAALERIGHAFASAVGRCTADSGPLGISLSGGLDSRTIMAAVPPSRPLTCVTLGIPGSMDLRFARQLAALSGRTFVASILDARFLQDYERHLRRMIDLTEAQVLATGITVPTIDLYRRMGIRTLLRGHGGELMHMDRAYRLSLDSAALALRDRGELEAWALRRLGSPIFDEPGLMILRPRHRDLVASGARTAVKALVDSTDGVMPLAHRLWLAFVKQMLQNAVAPSIVKFETVAATRVPYVDADLMAALFAARPALKLGDRIQRRLLQQCAPKLVAVRDSNTDAPLGASSGHAKVSLFAKRALARLGMPGYQHYERLGAWLRQEERDFVQRVLLSARCLDRGLLDRAVLRSAIDDHAARRRNHTYLILALLTLELGQREFIDGSP